MVPSNTVAAGVDEEATTEEAGAAHRSKARRSDRPIGHGDEEAVRRERRAAPRDDTGMRRLARCRAAWIVAMRLWFRNLKIKIYYFAIVWMPKNYT